jgi:hypothetical protein
MSLRNRTPLPRCAYCLVPIHSWPSRSVIEPCGACKRPLTIVTGRYGHAGQVRIRSVLGIASACYGVAVVLLIVAFALTQIEARQFVKLFTLLLFVIGSVLAVDGVLALRTGVDRTWERLRAGRSAKVMGAGKLAAGAVATLLVAIGVTL